ncbi:MAG: hypothetical protein ACTSU5_01315 [Promethearchaeota archaeon]
MATVNLLEVLFLLTLDAGRALSVREHRDLIREVLEFRDGTLSAWAFALQNAGELPRELTDEKYRSVRRALSARGLVAKCRLVECRRRKGYTDGRLAGTRLSPAGRQVVAAFTAFGGRPGS